MRFHPSFPLHGLTVPDDGRMENDDHIMMTTTVMIIATAP